MPLYRRSGPATSLFLEHGGSIPPRGTGRTEMPVCRKCESHFPNRLRIDGVLHQTSSRKYCLSCSPFDRHNTARLETPQSGSVLVCSNCSRQYEYVRGLGHTKELCNSCGVNRRRFLLKPKMLEYKGGKCQVCGYSRCSQSLHFHHLNPSIKEFNVSGSHSVSWSRLERELDKCVLLCSNCHGEVHAGLLNIGA